MKKQPEIQRIEDVEGLPVLRRFYDVPVAVLCDIYSDSLVYVPVIGQPHTDADLAGFEHYHVDGRFARSNSAVNVHKGKSNNAIATKSGPGWPYVLQGIERQSWKCRYKTGGINFDVMRGKGMINYKNFYRKHLDKKCQGKKCPHWGQTMQEQPDGSLQCPLHGLHAKDGVIVYPEKLVELIGEL